ncbi:MAG: hypothetical protein JWP31_1513 [Aeromicrobium sp.]|nr:hypothetical protein [Aeromicrobium sp.]
MGKSSRARRDARRQTHPRRPAPAGTHERVADLSQAEILALIAVAIRFAVSAPRAAEPRITQLNELGAAATEPGRDPAVMVVDEVLARIGAAWEHGWQPHDLVHAGRRRTTAAAAAWLARTVLLEAARAGALARAPQVWADQLRTLASRHPGADDPDALLPAGGRAGLASWTTALVVLHLMRELPRSQVLVPPPSQWGRAQQRRRAAAAGQQSDPLQAKTLTKVRALLAKAESTEFAAEAEAFTAKAQDLMARHSIDEALLADESGQSTEVEAVRVLIHHPYAMEKAGLLDVVARANRTRAVWNDFASYATLVGTPTDLAQVEMLFTSTLVQATRAMTQAGQTQISGHARSDRSSGFRKAFLSAYAIRIGERLTASSNDVVSSYTTDLVPVLQRQAEAIEGEFERLFPHVTTGSRRRQLDARGWHAGTAAADAAVIPGGVVES